MNENNHITFIREVKELPNEQSPRNQGAAFVTRKALVLSLIATMLLSTLFGAGLALLINRKSERSAYHHLSNHSLENSTGSELTIEEIVRKNGNAAVEINTTVKRGNPYDSGALKEGAGSGVLIRKDGYVLTNHHVIEGASTITVTLHDGTEHPAQIVGYDEQNDVAVLKIDGDNFAAATIGKSKGLAVGDLAVVIGNPLGKLGGTVTAGIISALDRKIQLEGRTLTLLQTDAAINAGNSGGGLFNAKGELVGIVVAKGSGTGIEGLGFVIPIDTAAPIADDIIANGTITGRPAAGISIHDLSEEQAKADKKTAGVYIAEVRGSNAKKAGFKKGDRIKEFEGEKITTSGGLIELIQKHEIGDEVSFKVERNGKDVTIKVKLQSSTEIK